MEIICKYTLDEVKELSGFLDLVVKQLGLQVAERALHQAAILQKGVDEAAARERAEMEQPEKAGPNGHH